MKIYVCSSNRGKLRETVSAANAAGLSEIEIGPFQEWQSLRAPEETGTTFEENAIAKAIYYSGFTSELVLADDSGLEVAALNGAPGIFSARYAGPAASDSDNNTTLLCELSTTAHRQARFVCVLALAHKGQLVTTARGDVAGEILLAPQGDGGFGYDPLFFYPALQRSFAQLSPSEKAAVSHRGKALRQLFERLPNVLAGYRAAAQ